MPKHMLEQSSTAQFHCLNIRDTAVYNTSQEPLQGSSNGRAQLGFSPPSRTILEQNLGLTPLHDLEHPQSIFRHIHNW